MKNIVLGLLAHVDAGKTTLSEALLFESGMLMKKGRVDTKDSFLDTNETERNRGITIYSKQALLSLSNETSVTLVDTPGHVDFSAEMERTLNILDIAILVVSGTSGVQSHTKTLWKLLKRYQVPTLIFVNKTDLPLFDREKVLSSLRNDLTSDFCEVTSASFFEDVAGTSESSLNEFLETGSLSKESVSNAIMKRLCFPLFFGSALQGEGVSSLLSFLSEYITFSRPEEFGAYCYKITRDQENVRLAHLKIVGGCLHMKEMLGDEKVNEIRIYNGDRFSSVREATAGEIISIPGLSNVSPGEAFGNVKKNLAPSLEPVLSYALKFEEYDNTRMMQALSELEEELPEIHAVFDEEHKEIRIHLLGEVQTEIITDIIKKRTGVSVSFDVGSITYKETILDTVEGVGHFEPLRHYAEVHILMEPMPSGSGLSFDSNVSEDLLERNWQRLILTHLKERVHRGVLTGSAITDMKLTVVGGKAHNKHTEGGDFRQATYRAIRQGLMQATCLLLEPYYAFTLEIPDALVGRAMTDIDRMHGSSQITESANGITVITGRAPVSTMHLYAKEVTAYSKGEGRLSVSIDGYDACHNTEEVLSKLNYNPDSDLRNPSCSVFCQHGAGTNIPWDEVFSYMHVPLSLGAESIPESVMLERMEKEARRTAESIDLSIGIDEIDSIINKTSHANQKRDAFSHKGISLDRAKKQREVKSVSAKEVTYIGSPQKQKYLLVDGYNVIYANAPLKELLEVNVDSARGRLLDVMCNYQALYDTEVIVVFDAYRVKNHDISYSDYQNIHVVFTRSAQTADMYIEHFSHENSKRYDITVATSDGLEQIITRGAGCHILSARELGEIVDFS